MKMEDARQVPRKLSNKSTRHGQETLLTQLSISAGNELSKTKTCERKKRFKR